MDDRHATRNVGRKPLTVLYSSNSNRAPPPVGIGKTVQAEQGTAPSKPTFIFCDQQDENADANRYKAPVEKKATFYLGGDDSDVAANSNRQSIDTKPFIPCNEDDENARTDFGHPSAEKAPNSSIMQTDEQDDNTVGMESMIGGSTKSTFVMYEDQIGGASANIDYEMKSRSSILCASMQSATASSFDLISERKARDLRRDIIYSCPDYAHDIQAYLRELEKKFRPKSHYIRKQPEIGLEMRTVLVDWLVDVSCEFGLSQETLHLAVSYTDRFLSIMAVRKEHLQLLGVTAMMIAAKYEEIYPPELQDFVYITDNTYTNQQVLQMEQIILKTLEFNLSSPTCFIFLISYLKDSEAGQRCQCLAKYLCDLALMEYSFLVYLPSMIAASCVFLAHYVTDGIPSATNVRNISGYEIRDIYPCAQALLTALKYAPDHSQQAIRDKYKDDKYCRVALLEPPESLPPSDSL